MRFILVFLMLLAGCGDLPFLPTVTPYKIDIQQGNMVTQDMVEKLQPGMSRAQVRFMLGTPLVADPFHPDRWDYVYHYKKGGQATEQRRLVVIFKDDKFVRVEGDRMPPPPVTKTGPSDTKPAKPAAPSSPDAQAGPGDKPAVTPPAPAKDASGTDPAVKEPKDEEKGFFGRILERLGF